MLLEYSHVDPSEKLPKVVVQIIQMKINPLRFEGSIAVRITTMIVSVLVNMLIPFLNSWPKNNRTKLEYVMFMRFNPLRRVDSSLP